MRKLLITLAFIAMLLWMLIAARPAGAQGPVTPVPPPVATIDPIDQANADAQRAAGEAQAAYNDAQSANASAQAALARSQAANAAAQQAARAAETARQYAAQLQAQAATDRANEAQRLAATASLESAEAQRLAMQAVSVAAGAQARFAGAQQILLGALGQLTRQARQAQTAAQRATSQAALDRSALDTHRTLNLIMAVCLLLALLAIVVLGWRVRRYQTIVVQEAAASVATTPEADRVPTETPRIIDDAAVIDRLDAMAEGARA
jgi:hypothetical protein